MSPSPQSRFRFVPWYVLLPFAVFTLHAGLFGGWLIDDAGISFAYARNFIHGHGLVAQKGVQPVEGFSNPLWTFLIAPVFINDPINPAPAIKLISLALTLGTFMLAGAICRMLFRDTWWARATAASALLFLSISTSFVVWAVSGLENPLYALLCAIYCWLTLAYATVPDRCSAGTAAFAGLAAAGLALTRPDGIVFVAAFPGVVALRLFNEPSQWRADGRRVAVFVVSAALPVLAYSLFRIAYFGDFYPNTYRAKGGASFRDLVDLALLSREQLLKSHDLLWGIFSWRAGLAAALLLLGIGNLLIARRRSSSVVFLVPFAACAWAVYCLLPRDWMQEYRFATPFLLLLSVLLVALLADIVTASSMSARVQKIVFLAAIALLLVHSVKVYGSRSLRWAEAPKVPLAEVAARAGAFNYYADTLGIQEGSFLCQDMGGTLYFSRHRMYDLVGLCDRKIAPLMAARDKTGLRDYVFELRPTFIHVHTDWSWIAGFHRDARFRSLYATIVETQSAWGVERGLRDVYDGDYVLRAAIPSAEKLERLREDMEIHGPVERRADVKNLRPFPRG